jgi:hypothetical protein
VEGGEGRFEGGRVQGMEGRKVKMERRKSYEGESGVGVGRVGGGVVKWRDGR